MVCSERTSAAHTGKTLLGFFFANAALIDASHFLLKPHPPPPRVVQSFSQLLHHRVGGQGTIARGADRRPVRGAPHLSPSDVREKDG